MTIKKYVFRGVLYIFGCTHLKSYPGFEVNIATLFDEKSSDVNVAVM